MIQMAKTVQIWDKKSPINGYPADKFLEERGQEFGTEDIILILDGDRVVNVEKPSTLKANLGLDNSLTSLEIGQAYLTHLTEQETKVQEEQVTIEKLKEQLETEKQNRIQLESTVLEMLGGMQ